MPFQSNHVPWESKITGKEVNLSSFAFLNLKERNLEKSEANSSEFGDV